MESTLYLRRGICGLLFLAACGSGATDPDAGNQGADASSSRDATEQDVAVDAGGGDVGAADDGVDAGLNEDAGAPLWPSRSCELTIRHTPAVGTSTVQIVGEFTDWADAPMSLRDLDGDGTFELTLSPSDRLRAGQLYAYKLNVDGTWIVDPNETHRKHVTGCAHSALRMPACSMPLVASDPVGAQWDGGRLQVRLTVQTASDGVALNDLTLTLDGAALPDDAVTIDPVLGVYDVAVSGLSAGRHLLSARLTDVSGRAAEPVDLPFWIEEDPFEWRDATMYAVLIDRFANGDRSNDQPVGAPVERPADFHGGDLTGVTQVLRSGYFEDLGVNVIALSPVNRQATGHFGGRQDARRYAAYHGEWPTQGRQVELRFGGDAALRTFVDEAHARGIRVVLNLIQNQVHEQHDGYVAQPSWFRRGCVCGIDPGCGWRERPLDCLFASYLPDVDWTVADAEQAFVDDAVFWVETYGVDGFRIDAVEHTESNAVTNLRARLAQRFEQGGERLFLVGQTTILPNESADFGCGLTYPDGFAWLDAYVADSALDGQFDVPTHQALRDSLVQDRLPFTLVESAVRELETRFSQVDLHVRFFGSRTSNRMASRAAFDPAADCRWPDGPSCTLMPQPPTDVGTYERLLRAFTILYTLPGIPMLFYGDEVAQPGGLEPDNRRDMVWTGPLASVGMAETTLLPLQDSLRQQIQSLGRARRDSRALRRGRRLVLEVTDTLYVYAYVHGDPDQLAVVAVNRGADVTGLSIAGLDAADIGDVTTFLAAAGSGIAALQGTTLSLTVPAGGAVVFVGQ